ncbi:ethanolamine utilization protein EutJ [Fluoribacter dumoffii]|uniref:Ethanolamine utilization protein EutJ n=2 Tax=Fluoribacter dumoffii TaxID=463 RepID=A0A377G7N8_9GAMM|nr:Tfp pilus assembly protein, ATPase PilM [Fluoribacter dumoffii NY 23]STO20837.1 ethanolamine utilization protein EutJ [Fluoribacter dumoffii]
MHGRFKGIGHMLKLFQPKHRSILGIDITSTTVKVLEISGQDGALVVENYGREVLPSNAMDGNTIKDIETVSRCIKKVIERLHTPCKQAALAVPDASVISKLIQINEGLNDDEMEELIVAEADKYIPYPIDEINLDFEILGHSEKNPHMLDVLIVASRAENVNQRVETAVRAGLDAVVIDVESFAVERASQQLIKDLPASGKDKTIAIIDIGACYTHLFVLQAMKLVYSREEKFGGKQLIESIAEHYKMTLEQAALAKENGELPEDYEKEVLEPFKEDILLQIKRTLQFFYSTSQDGDVDHILLAGGLAKLPGLVSLVQERLGMSTTIANPFANMTPGRMVNLDSINNDAPALMVACGLALRDIK